MKIKTLKKPYEEVAAIKPPKHKKPRRPSLLFHTLVRILSQLDLWSTRFRQIGSLPKDGPYLVLMNHSSFIDLKIASKILYPRPYHIVCTHDALIGKRWLMRLLGCIPTRKFVSDIALIRDMQYALKKGNNVLMYPEAGYSFDGKATPLPPRFGRLLKLLDVPVVFIETKGAFARDPLYNGLQLRRVPVSALVSTLFTGEEVRTLSVEELDAKLELAFSFDNFAWQRENGIRIGETFRADGLERILYRCPFCQAEGKMRGEGIKLFCDACGKVHTLTELGELSADDGDTRFSHIPDWYAWQREAVRKEILDGTYLLDVPVDIGMLVDCRGLYTVGKGQLRHTPAGFFLTGCDGKLRYKQRAISSYTPNSDYFWYEIGDVIGIGDHHALYYCFPPKGVSVAKARLAAEELYKLHTDVNFHRLHMHFPEEMQEKTEAPMPV